MEQELKDLACVETSETKDSKKRWQSPELAEIDYQATNAGGPDGDQDGGSWAS
jgi:hypothetical protein